nr:hypothetical protein [Acinetobacter lwoffii]
MDIKEEILAQMDSALRPEFDKAIDNTIEGAFKEDVKTLGFMVANSIKCQWEVMKPHLFYAYCLGVKAQEAKAQAVPEWKDYTVESPRIDGPYQIFIMNQQLVAKWESPWGFSSIEDGDALNQELITHWSVLGNDPAIEPQEPAND